MSALPPDDELARVLEGLLSESSTQVPVAADDLRRLRELRQSKGAAAELDGASASAMMTTLLDSFGAPPALRSPERIERILAGLQADPASWSRMQRLWERLAVDTTGTP